MSNTSKERFNQRSELLGFLYPDKCGSSMWRFEKGDACLMLSILHIKKETSSLKVLIKWKKGDLDELNMDCEIVLKGPCFS